MEKQFPKYYSHIFNCEFYSNELITLQINDLVMLQDEVNVDLEDIKIKYHSLTRSEKNEGSSSVINDYRNLRIFAVTLKREIYYKCKSKNAGLIRSKEGWKQRARILGEMLGYTKDQVKSLVVVNPK